MSDAIELRPEDSNWQISCGKDTIQLDWQWIDNAILMIGMYQYAHHFHEEFAWCFCPPGVAHYNARMIVARGCLLARQNKQRISRQIDLEDFPTAVEYATRNWR